MKDTPKYMRSIDPETKGLVVEYIENSGSDCFKGIVAVKGTSEHCVGKYETSWINSCFEPCKLITANLSNDIQKDNTTQASDIEIRLKCLELAKDVSKPFNQEPCDVISWATEFYNWVTQTTK